MAFDKIWEQIHRERSWGAYPNEHLVRWAIRSYPDRCQSILDLGCGQGASSWFLAREGFKVVAVDGSVSALNKAIVRHNKENLPLITAACCATQLPFRKNSFDAVVDVICTAHNQIKDMRIIFREINRVLKDNGRLFSIIPTNRSSRSPFQNKGAISFLERWEVEAMLLEEDFENIEVLSSSYHLTSDCMVENWVVTANRH